MKAALVFLFSLLVTCTQAQTIDRSNLYGSWRIKGVMLQKEIVSFYSADTLTKKLVKRYKAEHPGAVLPKGDSIAMAMGASILCELLYDLQVVVNRENEMIFYFTIRRDGALSSQMQTLRFTFKNDHTLSTIDEKGNTAEITIQKLTPALLHFTGISSARNMELCFKRE